MGLKEVLGPLPSHKFDPNSVRMPFVDGFGTAYDEAIERMPFHMNKTDEHGNTLLTVASQNGHMHISQLLVGKGANPSHQNVSVEMCMNQTSLFFAQQQGQTAAHYAMAYNFF